MLTIFENWMLRSIFGPEIEEETEGTKEST
jgi:hypothetical protein